MSSADTCRVGYEIGWASSGKYVREKGRETGIIWVGKQTKKG